MAAGQDASPLAVRQAAHPGIWRQVGFMISLST